MATLKEQLKQLKVQRSIGLTSLRLLHQGSEDMGKGKDKPSKQAKKPKSDKPKGSGSAYQQDKASGKKG